jgi:predicted Zn-dependent peptidase
MLEAILNGTTGRLYKSLVLDQQVANSAYGRHEGRKYEGFFELRGVAKPGKTPEQVEQALYKEIEKLQNEPVPDRELQKVKNEQAASNFRGLQSDFSLMRQLLSYDAYRGWQTINTEPQVLAAVTAQDIQRVARKYFGQQNRNVLILYRKSAPATAGGAQ